MSSSDPLGSELASVLDSLVRLLNEAGVAFFVGGSFASSVHGEFRATNDINLVCNLDLGNLGKFCSVLGADFYIDPISATEAIGLGRSFNIFHIPTAFKVDIFSGSSEYHQEQHRRSQPISLAGVSQPIPIASAEDIILTKLCWYRLGQEASDRQWRDLNGVFRLQAGRLDEGYLKRWASQLGVADLLDRLEKSSGANK